MFDFEFDNKWGIDDAAEKLNISLFGLEKKKKNKQVFVLAPEKGDVSSAVIHDSDDEKYSRKGKRKLKERNRKRKQKQKSLTTSPEKNGDMEVKDEPKALNLNDSVLPKKKKKQKKIKLENMTANNEERGEPDKMTAVGSQDKPRKRKHSPDTDDNPDSLQAPKKAIKVEVAEVSEVQPTIEKSEKKSNKKKRKGKNQESNGKSKAVEKSVLLNSSNTFGENTEKKSKSKKRKRSDEEKRSRIEFSDASGMLHGYETPFTHHDNSEVQVDKKLKMKKHRESQEKKKNGNLSPLKDSGYGRTSDVSVNGKSKRSAKSKTKEVSDLIEKTQRDKLMIPKDSENAAEKNAKHSSFKVFKEEERKKKVKTVLSASSEHVDLKGDKGHSKSKTEMDKTNQQNKLNKDVLKRMLAEVNAANPKPGKKEKLSKEAPTSQTHKGMPETAANKLTNQNTLFHSPLASVWGRASGLAQQAQATLNSARFRFLNEQLYTCTGREAQEMFEEDGEAFRVYHQGYQSQVSKWQVNPLNVLVKQFKDKPKSLVIADLGCGEGQLAKSVPQKVHSFDLVSLQPHVIACNMAKVPLASESVDFVVFCLSLMGTNLADYIAEANRILKPEGLLKIAEVSSRFSGLSPFISAVCAHGFLLLNKRELSQMFYMMDFKKVKSVKKGTVKKAITLKPCIYKKR